MNIAIIYKKVVAPSISLIVKRFLLDVCCELLKLRTKYQIVVQVIIPEWAGQKPISPLKYPFEIRSGFNDRIIPGKARKMIKLSGGYTLALKSSQKRERQNEKRRLRNRSYKSKARTLVRKAFVEIEEQNLESAQEATAAAVKALDKAAAKGVINKNNASRRKGRLMTRLAALEKGA